MRLMQLGMKKIADKNQCRLLFAGLSVLTLSCSVFILQALANDQGDYALQSGKSDFESHSTAATQLSQQGSPSSPAQSGSEPDPETSTEETTAAGLKQMEERLFNRTFSSENITARLDRIENFALGAVSKSNTEARMSKLKSVFGKTIFSKETDESVSKQSDSTSSSPTATSSRNSAEKPEDSLLSIINQGIDNYNRHRFHNAEDDFNKALDLAPGMSRIHAYLGVTLLQLNQRQAAIDALRASYELDPFGSYGRYSKNCLITLMGDEEIRKRGPKDNLKTVERTIGSVNRSADTDSQRHNQFGAALANIRQSSGNTAASRLFSDPDGWTNQMALRQNYIRNDAFIQATRTRQDAAHRAALTQESANNLKALIASKHLPGDAKLRAFGTTLNARYYGDETYNLAPWYIPREAPLELKAKPASLKSPGSKTSTATRRRVSRKAASSGKSYRGKATGARSSYAAKRSGSKAPPSKSSKAPPSKSSKAPASKSSKAPAGKSPVKASTRKN